MKSSIKIKRLLSMELTESVEMYLESIYLLEKDQGHARVVDISNFLDISKPSVTKAMHLLREKGLIHNEAYGHITLTEKGKAISKEIVKKHNLISSFLEHSLGLSPIEASENACKMEHVISDKMIGAIKNYLKDK